MKSFRLDTSLYGHLKTYIIPAKYNQDDIYTSQNGEYYILLFYPPVEKMKSYHMRTGFNANFQRFIEQYDDSFKIYGKDYKGNTDTTIADARIYNW